MFGCKYWLVYRKHTCVSLGWWRIGFLPLSAGFLQAPLPEGNHPDHAYQPETMHTHSITWRSAGTLFNVLKPDWINGIIEKPFFLNHTEALAEEEALLAAHLSVTSSILAVLQGTHGCRVWPWPQVKAQAQQRWSGQMTLQLLNQVLLFLQLITLRQEKWLK